MANYVKATNFTAKDSLPSGNSGKIIKGAEIDTEFTAIASAVSSKADINSPSFTGTPTAPTAGSGTNTTQVATTAFVTAATVTERTTTATLTNKTFTSPTVNTPTVAGGTITGAAISGGTITGLASALPVASGGTGATTATGTGSVVLSASPALTGTPTAPTATFGTNTTQLATTAFVTAALQAVYPVGSIYINAASSTNPATLMGFGTWTEFGAGRVLVGINSSDTLFDTLEETGGSKDATLVSHTHTATVTDPEHTHATNPNPAYVGTSQGGHSGGAAANPDGYPALSIESAATGISVGISTEGASATNANVQPFIVVKMWKRTA